MDKEKVLKQGVKLSDVYDTLQAYMGGLFVNYFNDFGRAWQVRVQAEAPYRSNLDYAGQFYVRNAKGEMVPLSALTRFETRYGPEFKMRFNLVFRGADYRQCCTGLQLRPGDCRAGRGLSPDDAVGDGLRLHGHVAAGTERLARAFHPRSSSGSRCCSSFSSSLRCMKAGRCRSVSC